MAAIPVIAIFDAGKTNKKVFLFDEHYNILHEQNIRLSETTDEDGYPCEDISELTRWVLESFRELNGLDTFAIKAVNFCSYGASLVHLDARGKYMLPLYNYLKPYPVSLMEGLFAAYGGEKYFSRTTASPVLGSLNSGLQLYRLKKEGSLTSKPGYSLHLPQYLSFLLTGKPCSDITSIGCHTMLWDFEQHDYHSWVSAENILNRLAPLLSSDETLSKTMEGYILPVGIGLHDSSAALIPYLSGFHQPFVLISTGSWCITLNPFNHTPLTDEELRQDCLCYMTYRGKAVKASRLFAGYEHETQVQKLAAHFHKQPGYFSSVAFSRDLTDHLEQRFRQGKEENILEGMSAFDKRDINDFGSYEEAYHQLILDIMQQQVLSSRLVMEGSEVSRIFVDGGFGKNPVYMNLLARAFRGTEVYAASVAQATAMGAALAIHPHWNRRPEPSDIIELRYYAGDWTE